MSAITKNISFNEEEQQILNAVMGNTTYSFSAYVKQFLESTFEEILGIAIKTHLRNAYAKEKKIKLESFRLDDKDFNAFKGRQDVKAVYDTVRSQLLKK